jgi:hypothetical protein
MARSRGSNDRRRKLAQLPYVVECPIPGGGLRERLDQMHAWAQRTYGNDGYATSSRRDRAPDGTSAEILRVHFADETTVQAFAREFALPCPPPQPRRAAHGR